MKTIDLSGKWICSSPDGSIKKEVMLPGSSCENGIGKKAEYFNEYTKETVRAPLEKYEYIGELIYERDIEIPADWADKNIFFFFERINIASKLWIDDVQIGRGVIELSTPHIYKVTDRHNPQGKPLFENIIGKHHIKLLIDNSNLLNMGIMASGYSIDTQGYWNGVIGKMEIQAHDKCFIDRVAVFPNEFGINVSTYLVTDRHIPLKITNAKLSYKVYDPNGKLCKLDAEEKDIELFAAKQTDHIFLHMDKEEIKKWDEFDRNLYTIEVSLDNEECHSTCVDTFGFRTMRVDGKRFTINGKALSLRGTINCAQYPLTGYPPMDEETWIKHFNVFKEHGLNHVRFHAWCPPEAAFLAADKLGIYLSVEMPLWLNWDVTEMELGDDEWHELYYRAEAHRISETYGNHPSFCFFSNGNENLGDFTLLENLIAEMKAVDKRRLYTMTSNFDHPLSPEEDYLSAFEIYHKRARIQTLHDEVAKNTCLNYNAMAEEVPVPFASFEVGQYVVYPNVDLCERYTGNILPTNLDIIRKMMKEKGVYEKLNDYIMASGDLAAKLYKEDIEAVLRTKGMGGFQLLSLVDYTGQSTATVGVLDIFHESKGVIEPKEWRGFCSEVVPLLWANRIFTTGENFEAKLSLYDYGKEKIARPVYRLEMFRDDELIFGGEYMGCEESEEKEVNITIPLGFVRKNSYITVKLSVNGYTNSYRIFVYADDAKEDKDAIGDNAASEDFFVNTKEDLEKAITEGRNVIALPGAFDENLLYKNSFVPVFWSPVHFPSPKPCGAFIEEKHETLCSFPTGRYIDYQWKDLLENSVSIDISGRDDIDVVMEMVPNFVDNVPKSPLFIKDYAKSKVLFCGFDFSINTVTARMLKKSLVDYISK